MKPPTAQKGGTGSYGPTHGFEHLRTIQVRAIDPRNLPAVSNRGSSSFPAVFSAACQVSGTDYDSFFQADADTYQVPVNLLKAVAKAESDFNPNAVSRCGAQGIMQLMPATARSLGVTDAFDPAQNIMGGAKYLRQMLDQFDGNPTLALAGYNAGPNAVQKYGGVPPYKETQNYVAKVLAYAGIERSAPAASSPAAPATSVESGGPDLDSLDALNKDELLERVMQEYQSSGMYQEEATRLRIQSELLLDENDDTER